MLRYTYSACLVAVCTRLKIVNTGSEKETRSLGCRYAMILEEPIQIVCNAVVWFSKGFFTREVTWLMETLRFEISFRNRGRKLVSFPTDTSKVPWGEPAENVCWASQL